MKPTLSVLCCLVAASGVARAAEPAPTLRLPGDTRPTGYQLALAIDPTQPRFSGHATIAIALDRARNEIWLHGRGLHVTTATVTPAGGAPLTATWQELPPDGFVRVTLPRAIGPGKATIDVAWDAPFNDRLVGLYKAREQGIDYAFTQFESIDARAAFPCFDEPMFKTPFDVTLTVPAADAAIGNTRAVEEVSLPGGKRRVRFATTKPLPTYLVAFAVGPFDVVTPPPLPPNQVRHRPLPVRGIAPRGRGAELGFALDAAAKLLVEEERYFGIEYPYDKLDHIAVPDFGNGAMENAGAITYREEWLLYTEGKSPTSDRHEVIDTMAHEMAHQWFGNLVTLGWWTDAWLNESFATWMASRTVEAVFPEEQGLVHGQRASNGAMSVDALTSARAIRQPVKVTSDIWNAFDGITYEKGAGVLRMFERWMGEDAFRRGVSAYLRAHAFGGGSTADLLRAYSEAAGRDVAPAFETFIEQAGVPLVEASLTCSGGQATLALTQSRYLPLGSTGSRDRTWQIPVCARYGDGEASHQSCTLLDGHTGKLALEGGCPTWVMPNAGGAGYYRWALGSKELAALAARWSTLDASERLSFIFNVRAGMLSGAIAAGDAIAALTPAAHDRDGSVALYPVGVLTATWDRLVDERQRPRVAAYAAALYRPVLERLGWTPRPGEQQATRELRADVIGLLTQVARDPAARKEALVRARRLFDVKAGTLDRAAVAPDLVTAVLSVRVQEEGAPIFDALVALLDRTSDAGLRNQIDEALTATTDARLATRALDLVLTDHVRSGERLHFVNAATSLPQNRARVFAWLKAHLDQLVPLLPDQYAAMLPRSLRNLCDPAQGAALRALFEPRRDKIGGVQRSVDEAVEGIAVCSAYVAKQRASAEAYFRSSRPAGVK